MRPWRQGDQEALLRHANNPNVSRYLGDQFAYPYTPELADWWIQHCESEDPKVSFAIEVDGEAAGGVGVVLKHDIDRKTANVGYWLGEAYWGRGIVAEALAAFTEYAFTAYDLARLQASVFPPNTASCRVLEKAGYVLEARLRNRLYKHGRLYDQLLYAKLREQ